MIFNKWLFEIISSVLMFFFNKVIFLVVKWLCFGFLKLNGWVIILIVKVFNFLVIFVIIGAVFVLVLLFILVVMKIIFVFCNDFEIICLFFFAVFWLILGCELVFKLWVYLGFNWIIVFVFECFNVWMFVLVVINFIFLMFFLIIWFIVFLLLLFILIILMIVLLLMLLFNENFMILYFFVCVISWKCLRRSFWFCLSFFY